MSGLCVTGDTWVTLNHPLLPFSSTLLPHAVILNEEKNDFRENEVIEVFLMVVCFLGITGRLI